MSWNLQKTQYETRDGAAWITLNSPGDRNALSEELVEELIAHLGAAEADAAVRCIILTGEGPAFCAGANLKSSSPARGGRTARSPIVELLDRMWNGPKPIIAAVNGAAFGGGLGLVAAADIVIAAESAKFSFSEVHLGVIPAIISVVCIPKLGPHRAMRLFLTGERFGASEAVGYGLVHKAVPDGELGAAVAVEIAAIRRGGPLAVAAAKRLVRQVSRDSMEDAFGWTQKLSAELFASAEAAEGIAAFREKRSPAWLTVAS
jgi:methylglutaconyl-CoA hydratase